MKYKINILQMAYHADNENTRKVKTGTQMIMIIETILSFHRLLQSSVFNNMNKMFKVHKCLNMSHFHTILCWKFGLIQTQKTVKRLKL